MAEPESTDPRGESPPLITAQRRSAAFEGVHPAGAPPIDPGPRQQQGFIHDDRWIQAEPDPQPFAYAVLRVVPRVERGERLNAGVVLYCRRFDFLDLRTEIDDRRLAALAPDLDPALVRARLDALCLVVRGDPSGGALASLEPSERFGWLVAPSSTIIQPSEVHTGMTNDPATTLDRLFAALVA